jgi:sulfatase maturation enzyme AslB (radical SAM superfamily)
MQGQEKSTNKMNEENITSILIFMENYLQTHKNINELVISLFGGEPMLNKDLLYKFCDESNELAIKYKCKTYFTMTSNMTLLDDKMLEYMKALHKDPKIVFDDLPCVSRVKPTLIEKIKNFFKPKKENK